MLETISERMKYVIDVIMIKTKRTKRELAEELEITPSALTQLTNGQSKKPSEKTLQLLNNKFGINKKWILNGSNNSLINIFNSENSFSNLREEIKILKTDCSEKNIICTKKGWARILDYIYNSQEPLNSINPRILSKIKKWKGIYQEVRILCASPVFLDNYSNSNEIGRVYSKIIFYLEGTPPKGFIIAEKINMHINQKQDDFENRVLLKCFHIFRGDWTPVKLGGKNCFYYIDLSHTEFLSIIMKPIPKKYIEIFSKI